MNSNNKDAKVVDELKDIRDLLEDEEENSTIPVLDEIVPDLNEMIPELTQEVKSFTKIEPVISEDIPELTEEVSFFDRNPELISTGSSEVSEIPELTETPDLNQEQSEVSPELTEAVSIQESFSVTLDKSNSTETVEAQLIRTRHENDVLSPELLETPETISLSDTGDDFDSVDYNIQDQLEQIEQGLPVGHEDPHLHLVMQNELEVDEDSELENKLNQQLENIESEALVQRENIEHANANISYTDTDTTKDELTHSLEDGQNAEEEDHQFIIDQSWQKVEELLMNNLPPQLAGTYLHLLNQNLQSNKQQILAELALLDEDSTIELLEALDEDQGF